MKTREEIEKEYMTKRANNWTTYLENVNAALAARDAALAELDDPMARLIAAGRRAMKSHNGGRECRCVRCIDLRDAIEFAEQRRAQE